MPSTAFDDDSSVGEPGFETAMEEFGERSSGVQSVGYARTATGPSPSHTIPLNPVESGDSMR